LQNHEKNSELITVLYPYLEKINFLFEVILLVVLFSTIIFISKRRFRIDPFVHLFAFFHLILAIKYAFYGIDNNALSYFFRFVMVYFLYFYSLLLIEKLTIRGVGVIALVVVFISCVAVFLVNPPENFSSRFHFLSQNPNHTAVWLCSMLFLGLTFSKGKDYFWTILNLIASIFVLILIYALESRTAYLGVAVFFSLKILKLKSEKKLLLLILTVFMLVLYLQYGTDLWSHRHDRIGYWLSHFADENYSVFIGADFSSQSAYFESYFFTLPYSFGLVFGSLLLISSSFLFLRMVRNSIRYRKSSGNDFLPIFSAFGVMGIAEATFAAVLAPSMMAFMLALTAFNYKRKSNL